MGEYILSNSHISHFPWSTLHGIKDIDPTPFYPLLILLPFIFLFLNLELYVRHLVLSALCDLVILCLSKMTFSIDTMGNFHCQ